MLRTSSAATLSSIEPEVVEEVEPLTKLDDREMPMRRPLCSAITSVLLLLSFAAAFIMYDREEAISGLHLRGRALEDEETPDPDPLDLQGPPPFCIDDMSILPRRTVAARTVGME